MRTASDPLRASRKRIAELRNSGTLTSTVWAVWSQSWAAFITRETLLTRSSHSMRVRERSLHKRSGEPPSVREENSRRPAPRSSRRTFRAAQNGCSAAITAPPRPASPASIARALPVPALVRLSLRTEAVAQRVGLSSVLTTICVYRRTSCRVTVSSSCCCRRICATGCRRVTLRGLLSMRSRS